MKLCRHIPDVLEFKIRNKGPRTFIIKFPQNLRSVWEMVGFDSKIEFEGVNLERLMKGLAGMTFNSVHFKHDQTRALEFKFQVP